MTKNFRTSIHIHHVVFPILLPPMQFPLLQIGVFPLHATFDPHLHMPPSHVSLVPEQEELDPHLHLPLSQVSLIKLLQVEYPHLQMPRTQLSVRPEQDGTDSEHLQTLSSALQYAPEDRPLQDKEVPHIQSPETQFSPSTVHGQVPFGPTNAEISSV